MSEEDPSLPGWAGGAALDVASIGKVEKG